MFFAGSLKDSVPLLTKSVPSGATQWLSLYYIKNSWLRRVSVHTMDSEKWQLWLWEQLGQKYRRVLQYFQSVSYSVSLNTDGIYLATELSA